MSVRIKSGNKSSDIKLFAYGITLVLCNLFSLITYLVVMKDSNIAFDWSNLNTIMLMLAGIAIIFDRRRTVLKAVGTSAIAIAIGKLPNIIDYMTIEERGAGIISSAMFIIGIVLLILACNLFYTGIRYYTGICRGYFWHMISIAALILLDAYTAMISVTNAIHSGDAVAALQLLSIYMPIMIVYLFYIYLLNNDTIRDSTQLEIVRNRLTNLHESVTTDSAYICRSDAGLLIEGPGSWPASEPYGPVVSELRMTLFQDGMGRICVVQKWLDDDRLFFTVTDKADGTVIEAVRFSATAITADTGNISTCNELRLYDFDGSVRTILVTDLGRV